MKKASDLPERLAGRSPDDPATYEFLHRSLLGRVPAEVAKDLIQEVYARFLETMQTERSQIIRDPLKYLIALTRNSLADYLHRESRRRLACDEKSTPVALTSVGEHDVEALQEIEAAFGALSRVERRILLLSLQGYTYSEIGARLGLTTHTVKGHLVRARANIGMHLTGQQAPKSEAI